MADVKAIRDRLRDQVKAVVTGINVYDVMPSSPTVPALIFAPAPGVFLTEVTMDGVEDLQLVATVLVSKTVDENAQNLLDVYASEGAPNLANAIDAGPTTDWDYAVSQPARNYGRYTFGDGDAAQSYLGFEIPVLVGVS